MRAAKGGLIAGALALLALGGYALAPERPAQHAASSTSAPRSTAPLAPDEGGAPAVVATAEPAPVRHAPMAAEASLALRCKREDDIALRRWFARQRTGTTPQADITQALVRTAADGGTTSQLAFEQLLHRWPQDVGVAWTAWEHCLPSQACNREARARHLVAVDTPNGAAWLALMDSLGRTGVSPEQEYALARAADAPDFDLRRGRTYVLLYPAFAELGPSEQCWNLIAPGLQEMTGTLMTPSDIADMKAHGWELAVTSPGAALARACSRHEGAPWSASRRKDCIAVASRMAELPTLTDQLIGVRLLVDLLDDGDAARLRREHYRRLRWLMDNLPLLKFPAGSGARIWAQGEVSFHVAQLRERNLWPPPPDWLPQDEHSRRLILGD